MDSRDKIREYEIRMRAMERELRERQMQEICREENTRARREFETAERRRREDEELMRLRSSGYGYDYGRDGRYDPYGYEAELMRRKAEAETARLNLLRERIKLQEEENRRLKSQLYGDYSKHSESYGKHSEVPPNVYVTQHFNVPPTGYYAQQDETQSSSYGSLYGDTADVDYASGQNGDFGEYESGEAAVIPDGAIVFDSAAKLTFSEAYDYLSDKQKSYCDGLVKYACKVSGETQRESKTHVSVGCGSNQILKLTIKNDTVIAAFRIEDDRLRQLRLADPDTPIKIPETAVRVVDEGAYNTAKQLIDLRLEQIAEFIAAQKAIRKEKRKAKRIAAADNKK